MEKTKLGGASAILVGIFYLLTVILVLLSPPGENAVADHVTHMYPLMAVHYLLGFLGVFGIMVVLTISRTIKKQTSGSEWYPYSKVMAVIGFALLAINNFRQTGLDHELSHDAMQSGGPVLESVVIGWVGLVELSPQGWIDFGFVGIWILTVSVFSLKRNNQKVLSYLGLLGGTCFILTVLGNVTGLSILVMAGMGLGGLVVVPAWFIYYGILLLKKPDSPASLSSSNELIEKVKFR
ncbi:hypothetical protein A8F94_20200 [Bacillus sp. FJAT-27225]|uniref:hypothetical protein n=1 Tax=Bacillus sp. FJAT-27225 TaxID=1743144 RepID=UPI00080C2D95|nr:hypothetical protein [Bacillus sp. FJAT-27225]OCA82239.1 hypothetical protein A8F94_20200 [Bacillus sp. FJAT-27225]